MCVWCVKTTTLWQFGPPEGGQYLKRRWLIRCVGLQPDPRGQKCQTTGSNVQNRGYWALTEKTQAQIDKVEICARIRFHPSGVRDVLKSIPHQPCASTAFLEPNAKPRLIHEVKGRRADGHRRGRKEQAAAHFAE